MKFSKFSMSILIPIEYDQIDVGKDMQAQIFSTLCKQPKFKEDWWSEKGHKLFGNNCPVVKCYEFLQDNSVRNELGLYHNKTAWYQLKNYKAPKILFQINTIKIWFSENGMGFIDINIITNNIDIDDICNFQDFLVKKIIRTSESQIEYIGNEQLYNFSIKQLIQKICEISICFKECDRTYRNISVMSYILTENEWDEREGVTEIFRKICDKNYHYMRIEKYGNKMHWGISSNHIILIANGKNKYAEIGSNGKGGLYHSVFYEYMTLYTYMTQLSHQHSWHGCLIVQAKISL